MLDIYSKKLEHELSQMEQLLKLKDDFAIVRDVGLIIEKLSTFSSNKPSQTIIDLGNHVAVIAYLSSRLEFYEQKRIVEMNNLPALNQVIPILCSFGKASTITQKAVGDTNKIVVLLKTLETSGEIEKYKTTYRWLRMFLMMVCLQYYCFAGILARFLLTQIDWG